VIVRLFQKNRYLLVLILAAIPLSDAWGNEFADGIQAHDALTKSVRQLFENEKYAELDSMAAKFRAEKTRFPDGQWKLYVFYNAFEPGSKTPDWVFPMYISLAEKWRSAHPDSVTAQCALAALWKAYAWKARGGGYARDVKQEAWPLFEERLNKAWSIINQPLKADFSDCPKRFSLRLSMAMTKEVEENAFETLFKEAIRQAPDYYAHYYARANYLSPKWHGSDGDWQRFIMEISNRNPGGEGATIYARTAWTMFLNRDWQDFEGSGVSWDKMNAGFEQIERNYPNSPWILNWHARFACRAGNAEAMKLLNKIDSRNYYPEAWDKDNIEDCRSWAKLGKSREKTQKEKFLNHMKQLESRVFEDIRGKAEKGNRQVIGDLADMYLNGRGTTADPVAACAWLMQDDAMYRDKLADVIKGLTPEQVRQARKKAAAIGKNISRQGT
jgi:hypothetical protein